MTSSMTHAMTANAWECVVAREGSMLRRTRNAVSVTFIARSVGRGGSISTTGQTTLVKRVSSQRARNPGV